MKGMTWREFKDHIDKQLKELGIPEDKVIWYIDISFPVNPEQGKSDYKVPSIYKSVISGDGVGFAIS